MVMVIKKLKSFRSRNKCVPATTTRKEKVLYTQIKTQEQKDNSNTNNNSNNKLARVTEEANLVKAGERFVLRCQYNNNKRTINNMNNEWISNEQSHSDDVTRCKPDPEFIGKQKPQNQIEYPPNKKGVSLSGSSSRHTALTLHLDSENICTSTNISNCTCLETFNRALSRRRGAVCEVEVAERKGLKLYIELVLKARLIKRYF